MSVIKFLIQPRLGDVYLCQYTVTSKKGLPQSTVDTGMTALPWHEGVKSRYTHGGGCPSDPMMTFTFCNSSVNSKVALQSKPGGAES